MLGATATGQTSDARCGCRGVDSGAPGTGQSAQASGRAIALEDLTGIRERTNGQRRTRKERGRSNSWAFAQLWAFVAYKARAAGMPLVVPAAYTSQSCHVCLHIGARAGKRFRCVNPRCCWYEDADLNGARMIAPMGDSVMVPGGPGLSCLLDPRTATSPWLKPWVHDSTATTARVQRAAHIRMCSSS
jgi:IS605 OrfB family transposase